jgi:hypothetical protein
MMIHVIRLRLYKRLPKGRLDSIHEDLKIVVDNDETARRYYEEMISIAKESCILHRADVAYVDWYAPIIFKDGTMDWKIADPGGLFGTYTYGGEAA